MILFSILPKQQFQPEQHHGESCGVFFNDVFLLVVMLCRLTQYDTGSRFLVLCQIYVNSGEKKVLCFHLDSLKSDIL